MKKLLLAIFTLLFTHHLFAQSLSFAFPVQTKTTEGIIEGNYNTQTGIQTYFGVPFAKPPIGDLRWKDPQPQEPWKGIKETKNFGPRPMQNMVFGDMDSRSNGLSEDCLYLNVWTPAKRNSKNLPVLVYFYGGGNAAGDASEPRYDGEAMAKKGIVVITCNYRLNIFGNFAHPELSAESPHKSSGNYGYFDQLAALKWVNKNIAAFGGDPNHVTIAGESAGSIAVSYQMASPLSKGLIHAAIGESGAGINPTMAPVSKKEAEKEGKDFAEKFKVKSLKELRALSTRDLFEMFKESGKFGFPVVLDGYFLPATVVDLFNKEKQAQIPLLLGWNSAEIPGQAFMQGKSYTVNNYQAQVKKDFPNNSDELLKAYPASNESEVELAATAIASDRFIAYATWKWFDLHRKNSKQEVYRYLYSKIRPPMVDQSLTPGLAGGTQNKTDGAAPSAPKAVGAPHACEIEYCMGNLHLVKEYAWTADDKKVSATMSNYFANFIKTYNPNGSNLPEWTSAKGSGANPPVMIIDVNSRTENATNDARYEVHDKIYKNK